ncbi:nitrate reductase molybdenum cofactor assembly chaperone [Paracraurococcus lichenis]|uniref:Nitrate reductase molybdenum cofactor assembly chaperone n=1 Tax=Paracraurococcus lichenis TaxID=3064888 RepID=A0ABT9E3R9_9PROT|nr:nitrate reductase molybdenum cofactor assembly chaperone [Paracraurococcus sp. LOR1-02]MDO9710806.1 nitrate reductase molybdenum cofactor assembly chaperone [Paracraurococcus sp. LOR1-02]
MRASLRALAALLSYPSAEVLDALPEIWAALETDPALAPAMPGLARLLAHLGDGDPLDLEEEHVALFDRTRSLSLNLFEHVHGDSRERGPAMVELKGLYAAAGLEPVAAELPDYLPMLLEYAAVEPGRGAELLANAAPVLDLLHGRLSARHAPQAAVLQAVLLVAGQPTGQVPEQPEPEQTPEQLDAAWAEAPVVFGPGADPAADCGVDALAAKLRAAHRNPNPMPAPRPVIRHVAAASQG